MTDAHHRSAMSVLRAALMVLGCAVASLLPAGRASAQIADSRISAIYDVHYNGISLGRLNFNSTVRGSSYELQTDTKLKLPLLGSIFDSLTWRGTSESTGRVVDGEARPDNYRFAFRSGDKAGTIDIAFADNAVATVERSPKRELSSAYVPVKPEHLKNVFDPMSAVMSLARKDNSHRSACARSVPVYDGEQRFNLVLSYKRAVQVERSESGGYEGPVIVCRVRYHPVSGFKKHKEDIKAMADNTGIEVWLMPLPNSRNYAPYRFVVPLPMGEAGANLAHFSFEASNGRKIALVRQ